MFTPSRGKCTSILYPENGSGIFLRNQPARSHKLRFTWIHKFSKILGAISIFLAIEGRHEAGFTLRDRSGAWAPRFLHPRLSSPQRKRTNLIVVGRYYIRPVGMQSATQNINIVV